MDLLRDGVAFVRVYAAWTVLSFLAWPVIRLAGVGSLDSWFLSRAFGPALVSLVGFVAARALGLGTGGVLACGALACGATALLVLRPRSAGRVKLPRAGLRIVLRTEVLIFLGALVLAGLFGLHYSSRISGERALDTGLLSCLQGALRLPPEDFWFAGRPLYYYYFGFLVAAIQGKLALVQPWQSYFWGLVVLWIQCFVAVGMAARLLGARRGGPALVMTLTLLTGTCAALISAMGDPSSVLNAGMLWKAVRIIPSTINEVPGTSMWVSEFHAHVMALPFLVLAPALARVAARRASWRYALLTGALLGMLYMTDAWLVLPIAAVVCVVVLAITAYARRPGKGFVLLVVIAGSSVICALPMAIRFHGLVPQISRVSGSMTKLRHILIILGPVLAALLISIISTLRQRRNDFIAGLCLAGVALAAIVFCEVLYFDPVDPVFNGRMNTVFRFHFASYVMLALAVGAMMPRTKPVTSMGRFGRQLCWGIVTVFAVLNLTPVIGDIVHSRASWSADLRQPFDKAVPGLIKASEWLRSESAPGALIAESAGPPYLNFSLVSALSGRPAVAGNVDKIRSHGVPAGAIKLRLADLGRLYGGIDSDALIAKYRIDYIILGPTEQKAFAGCRPDYLFGKYPVAFRSGNISVLSADKK